MTTNFPELLARSLPGLYLEQDDTGDLRRLLELMSLPLAEIEASIGQLHDDRFIASCRDQFVGLIGSLVGATLDPALSPRAQRTQVFDALAHHRGKGLFQTLQRLAEDITGWRINLVDFSQQVTATPYVSTLNPVAGRRDLLGDLTPIREHTFHVGDPARMARLSSTDDPAPYCIDVRAPLRTTDRIGRQHFDHVGFFFSPSLVVADQRPNVLPPGSESGRFTFDNHLLENGDTEGTRLQLLDGSDGSPITRRTLTGHEAEFCGTRRGFTIRVDGLGITEPAFQPPIRLRTANLEDFDRPTDAEGNALELGPTDVAVDPQSGRFVMDLSALATTVERVRVDYLLAAADRVIQGAAVPLSKSVPELFSFLPDGGAVRLRDALDGTPIGVALRLGASPEVYHSTARGWAIARNGDDVALSPEIKDLTEGTGPVSPGHIAVDVERGRFQFPPGVVGAGDLITVTFAFEDQARIEATVRSLVQQLQRAVPAGLVPLVIDARTRLVDPALLSKGI